MTKLLPHQLQENLLVQLTELDNLMSVFCNPGEIKIEDPFTLSDMKEYVGNNMNIPPSSFLNLTVNLVIDNLKFELCVTLPHKYPHVEPEVFVRNHVFNRQQHVKINKDMCEFIAGQEKGEPCVFSIISWLQDFAISYVQIEEEQSLKEVVRVNKLIRYWIYSHHIYSKTKRKNIQDLANQLHVTGFCLPGKPGIICVEGSFTDVLEWWHSIKSMNWKKIICKVVEDDKDKEKINFLKFKKFEEVIFHNGGIKCDHMDMGEFHRYLDEHNVGYIFKDLFGVESKTTTS